MNQSKTLLFEHIPKTAGSTLKKILRRHYDAIFEIESLTPLRSVEAFASLKPDQQSKFKLVMGHGASLLKPYIDNPFSITFLREPVERFISQYEFIRATPAHRSHKSVSRLSIDDYCKYAFEHNEDNLQTRFLSTALKNSLSEISFALSEKHLSEAQKSLESFTLVGDSNHFDEALIRLFLKLGWIIPPLYRSENKGRRVLKIPTLAPQTLENIKYLERFDLKLYQWANEQYQWESSTFKAETFSLANRLYNLLRAS